MNPEHEPVSRPKRRDILHAPALVVILSLIILPVFSDNAHAGEVYERVMKAGIIRVGLPYNRVPQGFIKPSGEWVGFELDLAGELARYMNLKLEKVKINDKTWGPMLLSGKIDAAICRIIHSRSLESEVDFSVPYFFDSPHVLIIKGSFKNPGDLKGRKIAAVQGSFFEKTAMRLLKEAGDDSAEKNVVSFPDRPSCFMAVGKEQVVGWLDSGLTLLEYSSKNPDKFQLLAVSSVAEPLGIAVPQNDSGWRDVINFAIQDMAADGSFKKIYDKWFGADTPYPFPFTREIEMWPQ